MDLRIQKTRNSIINAFIELRSQKPIKKITIKELSDLALISKATFYLHFKDIYDLSEFLEHELIESIIKDVPHPEFLVTNTSEGINELLTSFISHNQLINILFSGNQTKLNDILEPRLKELIYEKFPKYKNNLEAEVILTVLIQGNFHAYTQYSKSNTNPAKIIEILGRISECLISYF